MPKRQRKEEEVEVEVDPSERDFVMARLGAARAAAQAAVNAIDDAQNLFINPDQDKKGKERGDLIESALEAIGTASRALEAADEVFDQVDMLECEPWEDGDGDDEDTDDEDDDEDGD